MNLLPKFLRHWLCAGDQRRLAQLQERVDTLAEMKVKNFNFEPGHFSMELSSNLVRANACAMSDLMDHLGADNFVEMELHHPRKGPLTLVLQRKRGKTSSQVAHELREQLADITAEVGNAHLLLDEVLGNDPDRSVESLCRRLQAALAAMRYAHRKGSQ